MCKSPLSITGISELANRWLAMNEDLTVGLLLSSGFIYHFLDFLSFRMFWMNMMLTPSETGFSCVVEKLRHKQLNAPIEPIRAHRERWRLSS